MASKEFKIFCGNANRPLAQEIVDYLGVPLGEAKIQRFGDGEICLAIDESVRGADIYVVQPTCYPTNDNIMELLIMIDAMRLSLIHISEPTRRTPISYAVFCLKK